MWQDPPRTSERTDALLAASWTLFIYSIIPFARALQAWFDHHGARPLFGYLTYAALAVGLLVLLARVRRGRLALSGPRWAGLALVAACYGWGTWHLRANPEEALHLVEYGVLSLLLLRALSHRLRDRGAYLAALLLGALLGTCDELIQWVTPRRLFDFRDIAINVVAVALMQAAWAWVIQPPYLQAPASAASLRLARRLGMTILLLLLLCASNTPARHARYLPLVPYLNETMVEYGHRHRVEGGITFFSRFTLQDLAETDARRAEEAGAALRAGGGDEHYEEFLRVHSTLADPFLHELRVHLFRRDRYWREAKSLLPDEARAAERMAVAVGENRIVNRYFRRTVEAAGLAWPAGLQARAEALAAPGPYESPVSNQLFTRFREGQMQAVFGGLLLVTWLGGRYAGRRTSSP